MEDYGLPTWGPYIIFAMATIVIGALLGLVCSSIIGIFYIRIIKLVTTINLMKNVYILDLGLHY